MSTTTHIRRPRSLIGYKQEVESGQPNKDHEESYARFLRIRQTPKRGLRVTFNDEEMETLSKITYSNRYGQLYTETSPIQRKIMETFKLTLPT